MADGSGPAPPVLQRIETLIVALGEAVADNTRDLSRVAKRLGSIADRMDSQSEESLLKSLAQLETRVVQLTSTQEHLLKVVLTGNGQKSVLQQLSEITARLDATRKERAAGERERSEVAGAALAIKGRWQTMQTAVRWMGPAIITGLIELLTHLHHGS